MTVLLFILRRARRHWQILLTLCLGVLLTTALLASGPLLLDTVVEMGLHLTLQSSGVADGNLRLTASAQIGQDGFQALDSKVQAPLRQSLEGHLDSLARSAESLWMLPWVDGQLAEDQRVNLRFQEGIRDHVDYVAGQWPGEPSSEPGIIRAIIGDAMARALVLRVGDRLPLSLNPNSEEPDIAVEVAGIVVPKNPRDRYWFGEFSPLAPQSTPEWSAQFRAIVPEEVLFSTASDMFPGENLELAWHVLLRYDSFSAADIEPIRAQLTELTGTLNSLQPPVKLSTSVPEILTTFQTQLESVRVPLYILIGEVMLLALYYVTMVASLSMGQVEREFAILRSRGTSRWQIARIQLVEVLIILAVAFVSGPWLGTWLVRGLAWAGPLTDVYSPQWGLSLTESAWLAAGVGALASLAGLLLPLVPALRRSIVTHQQMLARSTQPPWWQRLYLDVFVLLAGLVLLWRLRLYGGMTTGTPGGAQLDWLLMLSPVAFLLGSATILLRVFPLVLRAMAFLVARGPGVEGPLALWQTSRNPTHVTRLVLLLSLAIALGNLSTGLNITLDQSEFDRATYLAGHDLRLASQSAVPLVDLQSAAGVLQLSGAWRGQGTVDRESDQSYPEFEVLAIEPNSFSEVTTFRPDFSDQDMAEMVSLLAVGEGEHPSLLLLPGHPKRFGLWVWAWREYKAEMDSYHRWIDGDSAAERVGMLAKLQTAQGELFTVDLRMPEPTLEVDHFALQTNVGGRDIELRLRIRPDTEGWHYFEATLPVLPPTSYPLSLHSLWFENRATRLGEPIPNYVTLVLDDLTVVDAETKLPQIVEDFESLDRTVFLHIMQAGSIYRGLFTRVVNHSYGPGEWGQALSISFPHIEQSYPLRVRQTWTTEPVPAIASPTFMRTTELEAGDLVRTRINEVEVDFRIVGTATYFPTMYEQLDAGYLITSRDLLLALLNDTTQLSTNPNEALIQTDESASIDSLSSLVPMLSQSWQAESVRKSLKANPLALGLRGVTFFGSALTMLLSLVGFATHFYLSVRQREMLYGVMRAVGMSSRQLYGSIVLEQAVLILTGLVLGTGLGVLLNQITLPRLPVSLGDQQPIPPFVPRVDWQAIGVLYLIMVVAFVVMLGVVTVLLWRARIHRVLRIGQE